MKIKTIFSGEKWQKRRKLITPAFHFQILEQFIDVFNCATDIFIRRLRRNICKESVDIYPYVNLCTLDIICGKVGNKKLWTLKENKISKFFRDCNGNKNPSARKRKFGIREQC